MRSVGAVIIVLTLSSSSAWSWGHQGHRIIAEGACQAMPEPMRIFYKSATARISGASIEPDSILKPRDGEAEQRRHFINLEILSAFPFTDIPPSLQEAQERYGRRKLEKSGLLPWHIARVHDDLRSAFRERSWNEVARKSGWLSHYIADAYQPLHATVNFDGQKTCNQGIHLAFETDLIDRYKALFRSECVLPPAMGDPDPVPDPAALMLAELRASHELVADLLRADTKAVRAVKSGRADYFEELERSAGPMARDQMKKAASMVLRFWHSAWVDAGRPELPAQLPRRQR